MHLELVKLLFREILELKLQEQGQSATSDDPYNRTFEMLGTIKVPLNMKQLGVNLPESQYDSDVRKKKALKSASKRSSIERVGLASDGAGLGKINEETEAEDATEK